jgi:hypothetical protein
MSRAELQPMTAWAEDRAMLRSNPSADPGAKIEGRAAFVKHDAAHLPLRDWHESENPSRPEAAIHRQDAALSLANTKRSQFQFTVNQDTGTT